MSKETKVIIKPGWCSAGRGPGKSKGQLLSSYELHSLRVLEITKWERGML